MSKKGGYVIVDLKGQSITAGTPFTLDGVTARLNRAKTKACLLSGFAIGAEEKRDVFVDLQKTEDGYIALFGQYTLTIEDDEVTITNGGVLLENIVDSQGHKRFVEGKASQLLQLQGITYTYSKWSLSGTHLMLVLAGTIEASTTIPSGNPTLCIFYLPEWIRNKVIPQVDSFVDYKVFTITDTGYTSPDTLTVNLRRANDNLFFQIISKTTTNAKCSFRFVFDLLIDTAD